MRRESFVHNRWLLLGWCLAACSPATPLAAPPAASGEQDPSRREEPLYVEAPTYASAEPSAEDPGAARPAAHAPGEDPATNETPGSASAMPATQEVPTPDPFLGASFREPVSTLLAPSSPAMQNANLSPARCRKTLEQRKLGFTRLGGNLAGVAVAVRLKDSIHGVRFIAPGKKSPFGILDCRLALTLEPLAKLLAERSVVSVRVDNFYRRSARLPGSRKRSQHAYGLAMDVTEFTLADGKVLNVEQHWGGAIGEGSCGPEAKLNHAEEGLQLRNLVCEIARSGIFHHLLTPNHDAAHRDHLHLDIKRGAKSSMLR